MSQVAPDISKNGSLPATASLSDVVSRQSDGGCLAVQHTFRRFPLVPSSGENVDGTVTLFPVLPCRVSVHHLTLPTIDLFCSALF